MIDLTPADVEVLRLLRAGWRIAIGRVNGKTWMYNPSNPAPPTPATEIPPAQAARLNALGLATFFQEATFDSLPERYYRALSGLGRTTLAEYEAS